MDIALAMKIDGENPIVGDLLLENGTVRTTSGLVEEAVQDLYISLRMFKGEWFLDREQGIPYWQSILGTKTPVGIVSQIFRRAIRSRPTIKSIDSFAVERLLDRTIRLDFRCTLIDDTILLSSDYAPFIVGP